MDYPARILMLVSQDPDLDPRVGRVGKLCAEIAKTDVLGFVAGTQKPLREYDQTIYIERVNYRDYPISFVISLLHPRILLSYIYQRNFPRRSQGTLNVLENDTEIIDTNPFQILLKTPKRYFLQKLISCTLFQRARASSISPRLIICHGIQALEAGVKLKEKFNCRLLYDSHNVWTDFHFPATFLERYFVRLREQSLIRHADGIIADTPQIARSLERMYNVVNVIIVPDAGSAMSRVFDDKAVSDHVAQSESNWARLSHTYLLSIQRLFEEGKHVSP